MLLAWLPGLTQVIQMELGWPCHSLVSRNESHGAQSHQKLTPSSVLPSFLHESAEVEVLRSTVSGSRRKSSACHRCSSTQVTKTSLFWGIILRTLFLTQFCLSSCCLLSAGVSLWKSQPSLDPPPLLNSLPYSIPWDNCNQVLYCLLLKDILPLAAPWLGLVPASLRLVSVMGFTPDCEGYFINQL